MTLNKAFVGRQMVSKPYEVSAIKVAEFATALGVEDRRSHDIDAARSSGLTGVLAPPTFPITLVSQAANALLRDPAFGLEPARAVHGAQRFDHFRHIVSGDILVARAVIDSVETQGPHERVVATTEIETAEGEPICRATITTVSRGSGAGGPAKRQARPTVPSGSDNSYREVKLPAVLVTRSDLIRYAGASGDFNPLHWSDRRARQAAFSDVIAHGMFTFGKVVQAAALWWGDQSAVASSRARFSSPVFVPDDPEEVHLDLLARADAMAGAGSTSLLISVRQGTTEVLKDVEIAFAPSTVGAP